MKYRTTQRTPMINSTYGGIAIAASNTPCAISANSAAPALDGHLWRMRVFIPLAIKLPRSKGAKQAVQNATNKTLCREGGFSMSQSRFVAKLRDCH